MKNYLAIIRRADFIDLYKYGFFYLDKEKIVEFDCQVSELSQHNEIFDSLFSRVNPFESSFTYLIVNYTKEASVKDYSRVSIEELGHVFPLDLEAKREFESSFDEHIKIDAPIWNDAVSLIKKRQLFNSSMQGAKNIFNIFKLEGFEKCRSIIRDDVIEEMLSDVYDDKRPQGDLSLWNYLMRYERHSFYPKDSLGYFMDTVHIFVNYLAKREIDDMTVEETAIYQALDKLRNKDLKSGGIMESLKNDKMATAFLNKISEAVPEIDFITTAINYLQLRDRHREKFTYDQHFVESCKDAFGECFTLAAYMAGIAFGHDKTYSCLYELLPLTIYKSKGEMEAILLRKQVEKDKAMREMARLEMEQKLQQEIRKSGKRGTRTKLEHSPLGGLGSSQDGGGCSVWRSQLEDSLPPYQEKKVSKSPSSLDGQKVPIYSNAQTQRLEEDSLAGKNIVEGGRQSESLFSESEMQGPRHLKSFPLKMQRYTLKGKVSTAKDSQAEIKDAAEYKLFLEKHQNQIWKPM